ncbi:MAG TPA: hypothetical protein VIS94_03100 [Desulfomonilia bacterium]
MKKKIWQTPELLVLTRNNPAESVLAGCKTEGSPIDSNQRENNCYAGMDPCADGCWWTLES